MTNKITIDFETKSEADLKKVGPWAYSMHPSTDIICVCWAVDGGPVQSWRPGERIPDDIYEAVEFDWEFEAHNVAFERSIWANVLAFGYSWPEPAPSQWQDTMAVASYLGLPGGLGKLAGVLGLGAKLPEGDRLITRYSKLHLKTSKREIPPEDLKKFIDYCKQDVLLEMKISEKLGPLPADEIENFLLDQEINLRGVAFDIRGIDTAAAFVEEVTYKSAVEFEGLVGCAPSRRDKVLQWLHDNGLDLPNMQAETLEEAVKDPNISPTVRRALELRLRTGGASVKKLEAMKRHACPEDGRARWQSRFHGAQTGRTTGSGVQLLNLAKGLETAHPDRLAWDICQGREDWLEAVHGDPMGVIGKSMRHWLVAEQGHRLIAADFVSIEAVVLACLAGEDWKIKAFRDEVGLYELMADKIYGLPPGTVTKKTHPKERFDGKTAELAFGYQGALGAWRKFDSSDRHTDEAIVAICKAWRSEHPQVTKLWSSLGEAAIEAVQKGKRTNYRELGFEMSGDWLTMILPDGKRLWYYKPEIRVGMPPWHRPNDEPDCFEGKCKCRPMAKLTYMSYKMGQWVRVDTYGGKLTENACQAVSRQILMMALRKIKKAGHSIILTVYDEIVTEVPSGRGSVPELINLMVGSVAGSFAESWPIRASGWEGNRYR